MNSTSEVPAGTGGVAPDTGRLLTYGVAFIGLMGALYGATGLLGLLLAETVFSSRNIISATDAREQISYYLAALLVATPIWLALWLSAQRRVKRAPLERHAPDRHLFLAVVFAVTSIVVLFSLHTLLRALVLSVAPHNSDDLVRDGVSGGIRLLVYGTAGLFYLRLAWTELPISRRDPPRDLALHALSAFALSFLAIGLVNGITLIVDAVQGPSNVLLVGGATNSLAAQWGEVAAWVLSGGGIWVATALVERRHPGVRAFRVPYLYLVLGIGAAVTLLSGGQIIFELLRRAFGYRPDAMWQFAHDVLPPFLVAAVIWAYHWMLLRDLAQRDQLRASEGTIPWPRRPYLAALSFVGLALTATGTVLLLWVAVDFALKDHTLLETDWWRDQVSAGLMLLVLGPTTWLRPWTTLLAAGVDERERAADSRRRLLGGIVLIATLCLVAFTIAFLWLILRLILGGTHDPNTTSDAVRYLVTALVAAGLVGYHGPILRGDLRTDAGRPARLHITALVDPALEGSLADLSRRIGRHIEIIGYLSPATQVGDQPLETLEAQLDALAASSASRVLLVLHARGGVVYPYSRNAAAVSEVAALPADLQPAAATTS